MKNIIDFCKEYNYIPLSVPSNEFSVTNVDLPDGYSVLTKTLEDIFQSFYPKTLKNKFKNKFNEELYGVLIYFSFLEMFQLFIDTNKAKLIKKNQNVGDYRLDSSFVNEFLNSETSSTSFDYNLNLLYNFDMYQNQNNKRTFQNDFNQSIFFTLLSKNDKKLQRDASGNISFEQAFKFIIRYIASCELHAMVSSEIEKCKLKYGSQFNLHLKSNLYYDFSLHPSCTIGDYIESMESRFLSLCENKIYNIQEVIDHSIRRECKKYYHLDIHMVRQYITLLEEENPIDMNRFYFKKFQVYVEEIKLNYENFKKFDILDQWIVDILYNIFVRYAFDNLSYFSIKQTVCNFFNNVTYQSTLFECFTQQLERNFKSIPSEGGNRKNTLPECFESFSLSGHDPYNRGIVRALKDDFPIKVLDFHNIYLSPIVSVLKLYRQTRNRTNHSLLSFSTRWKIQTKCEICFYNEEISKEVLISALKHFFVKKNVPLMDGLSLCFSEYFAMHFKKNLLQKLKLPSIRLEWIKNDFCNEMFHISSNIIYQYCLQNNPEYYKTILVEEKNSMKEYLIENFEIISEKVHISLYLFFDLCKTMDDGSSTRYFKFITQLIYGVSMDYKERWSYEKAIRKVLHFFKKKKIFEFPKNIISIRMDEYLFYDDPGISKYLLQNYKSFVQYLFQIKSIFEEETNEFEKIIHERISIILYENLYTSLLESQENISS